MHTKNATEYVGKSEGLAANTRKNATEYVGKKRRSCSKYKESAPMSVVDHPIGQPSLDISPI
jgi:hypothetical protein